MFMGNNSNTNTKSIKWNIRLPPILSPVSSPQRQYCYQFLLCQSRDILYTYMHILLSPLLWKWKHNLTLRHLALFIYFENHLSSIPVDFLNNCSISLHELFLWLENGKGSLLLRCMIDITTKTKLNKEHVRKEEKVYHEA